MIENRSRAEHLSQIAGVMGFLLSLVLAGLQGAELYRSKNASLRLAEERPSDRGPKTQHRVGDSTLGFALHHDGGPGIAVDTVVLRLRRLTDAYLKDGTGHRTTAGFGGEGVFEEVGDETLFYLFQESLDGAIVGPEARSLPFTSGATRFYTTPLLGPQRMKDLASHSSRFASLEVWAQGRPTHRFDVTPYVQERLATSKKMTASDDR